MHRSVSPAPRSKTLLGEYLSFLKAPTYNPSADQAREIGIKIWRLFAAHFLLIDIPAVILISLASRWIKAIEDNKVGDLFEQMAPFQLFLLAVIFVPFLEELIFRLPLRFSVRNLTIPVTLVLLMGGSLLLHARGPSEPSGPASLIWLITVVVGSFASTRLLGRINRHQGDRWFSRYLIWLVYGSSVLFGLAHITNYPREAWIVTPLLVLPQLASGVLFAYIRIKFGFIWAFLTHGFNNFLVTSPLMMMALGSQQLQAMILDDVPKGDLLRQDQVVVVGMGLWVIGMVVAMGVTTIKLIAEWRRASNGLKPPKLH